MPFSSLHIKGTCLQDNITFFFSVLQFFQVAFIYLLATPLNVCDLSFLSRDPACASCRVPTTGPPGKSQDDLSLLMGNLNHPNEVVLVRFHCEITLFLLLCIFYS